MNCAVADEDGSSQANGCCPGTRSAKAHAGTKVEIRWVREWLVGLPLVDGALLALSIGACLAFAGGFVG